MPRFGAKSFLVLSPELYYFFILLRVSALLFYFAFLLKKYSSRVFETGSVGLVETQLFF